MESRRAVDSGYRSWAYIRETERPWGSVAVERAYRRLGRPMVLAVMAGHAGMHMGD